MSKTDNNTKSNFKVAISQLVNGTPPDSSAQPDPVETLSSKPEKLNVNHSTKAPESFTDAYTAVVQQKRPSKTAIASDTVVDGNIKTESDLEISGTINGSIVCSGHVKLCGNVTGDLTCQSIDISSGILKGEHLTVDKDAVICANAVVHSQITAENIEISGNVEGNITVSSNVSLLEHSVVIGNISSKSISIQRGAILKGSLTVVSDITDNSKASSK